MTLEVKSPADIFDVADLSGAISQIEWAIAKQMWVYGETFVLKNDGKPIGLCGLYPNETGAEAWFCVGPETAEIMLPLVRRIRLTLDAAPYPAITAFCATEAGQRIAALCGFRFVRHIGNVQMWCRDESTFRRKIGRQRGAAQTAGSQSAPAACGPVTPAGGS